MNTRRDQNKPPLNPNAPLPPRSPSNKKDGGDEVPLDKRRKIGGGKMVGQSTSGRRAFSDVNASQDAPVRGDSASSGSSECGGGGELTREGVEKILNEKMKTSKFDLKGNNEKQVVFIKKLRRCIEWFQKEEKSFVLEQENLRNLLELSERRCTETETNMKNKVNELETSISELRSTINCLEEKMAKVESEKMAALDSHMSEKESRIAIEGKHASIEIELDRAQQDLVSANHKIESISATYRNSQEYNTSLQQYNSRLQSDCETYKKNLERLEQEKGAMVDNLRDLRGQYNVLHSQLSSSEASRDKALKQKEELTMEAGVLRAELQQVRDDRDRQHVQVKSLSTEVLKYKDCTGKSFAELENLTTKSNALEETCTSQRNKIQMLQHQLDAANEKLKMSDMTTLETRTKFEDQNKFVQDLNNRLSLAEHQISEGEKLRKKLHNTILELKGNIRVFCRVRPLLSEDGVGTENPVIGYPSSPELSGRGINLLQSGQKHQFTFDKVFSYESSQQEVFVEISQLVQSALDGYKVCIFAYGQTGSGKTYTMMGPDVQSQKGLIPRSLEQIFQSSQLLASQGWKYKMQAHMLEIYNENIRDLLAPNRGGSLENPVTGKPYCIIQDANKNAYVPDLTVIDVCSSEEVSTLLHQAAQSRSVARTQMNDQSSRSHFVFTLRITGFNESTDQQVQGILNLVDLAGSERLSKSGSTGDRLKETQAINKSLSSLSKVIFALAKKETHIPFRDSKLTHLLQPCLGGDSKTLMFVNLSPDPSSVGESLCSLRFAARVNSCEIGVPRRQTGETNVRSDSRLSYG
ncbi:hypothetical protein GIB67_021150 [Kingdonia uniflora]|uniref:Kinesin motor domain-containing protein n=1 Tax=Kingdonia uniflora TaxID=39325 RepID=A0A7J7N6Z9_9MAGN|nr:hypothetical protein GIB67_021150 [Kingdonia uniflora]